MRGVVCCSGGDPLAAYSSAPESFDGVPSALVRCVQDWLPMVSTTGFRTTLKQRYGAGGK
jgi:hypothetical protein